MGQQRGRPRGAWRAAVVAGAVAASIAGCSGSFPADPGGTLARVRASELRVGVSANPPWTAVAPTEHGSTALSGTEVDLAAAFAAHLGVDATWVVGGEESLVGQLERSELDLVVGGLTSESPWQGRAALTRPYQTTTGPDGRDEHRVLAAPLGENAFLVELERFLLERQGEQ